MITVNGYEHSCATPLLLTDLLKKLNILTASIAIAINQEIIPHSAIEKTVIHEHDSVDIIKAVGGG